MLLYDAARPNPRAVRMALLEKRVTVPSHDVDVDGGENRRPDFLARNPGGQVPVLVLDNGVVDVAMTMTTPGCPAQDYIVGGVEHRLAEVAGVTGVFVTVVWSPAWSPRRMSPEAKAHFRIREDAE
jgi:hypothetical protein